MHTNKINLLYKNHLNHHKNTNNNMTLNKNKYNEKDDLYFTWDSTLFILIIGLIEGFVMYKIFLDLLNIKIDFWYFWIILFCIYQSSFWNTIHPDIHSAKYTFTLLEGIPASNFIKYIFENIYINKNISLYTWLKNNHIMHHLRKGSRKGNYNVTLPGADHLLGTYYDTI